MGSSGRAPAWQVQGPQLKLLCQSPNNPKGKRKSFSNIQKLYWQPLKMKKNELSNNFFRLLILHCWIILAFCLKYFHPEFLFPRGWNTWQNQWILSGLLYTRVINLEFLKTDDNLKDSIKNLKVSNISVCSLQKSTIWKIWVHIIYERVWTTQLVKLVISNCRNVMD
jgi:hypothetical protein